MEHDLIGRPVSTFPDHALAALLGVGLKLRLERREFCKRRIRVGRLVALAPLEAIDVRPVAVTLRTILPLVTFMPFATMTLIAALTPAVAEIAALARRSIIRR